VLTSSDVIEASMIEPWLGDSTTTPTAAAGLTIETKPMHNGDLGVICTGDIQLEDIERETIIATLHHHKGHRQRSASALGIGVRTLGLKLKKWKEQQLVEQTL
jgi:DNA-binding NtrC family response regulator